MNNLKRKISILVLSSILTSIIPASINAGIAFSGDSINSLSISSIRSENNYHYLIEIYIEGISISKVTFETDFQTLYLSAKSGGIFTEDIVSGAQVISLVFNFPANANLNNYFRVDKPNTIIISVPKS